MVESRYVPGEGDIVWLAFSPQAGHEQAGHRPALVLSPQSYNEKTGLALFCPITSKVKGYPFEVLLPSASMVTGVVLADQIRSLDWRARRARFEVQATSQVVCEVRAKLAVLLRQEAPDRTTVNAGEMSELLRALELFVRMFELVFDNDWSMTQAALENPEHLIAEGGTFIRPLVDDEGNNWANRGSLLAAYRDLLACMAKVRT